MAFARIARLDAQFFLGRPDLTFGVVVKIGCFYKLFTLVNNPKPKYSQ
jgi:hypothetical protein